MVKSMQSVTFLQRNVSKGEKNGLMKLEELVSSFHSTGGMDSTGRHLKSKSHFPLLALLFGNTVSRFRANCGKIEKGRRV